jgi:hypothetical protein
LQEVASNVAAVLLPLVLKEQRGVGPVAILLSGCKRCSGSLNGVGAEERQRFRDDLDLSISDVTVYQLGEGLPAEAAADRALEVLVEVDRDWSRALAEGSPVLRYSGVELANTNVRGRASSTTTKLAQHDEEHGNDDGGRCSRARSVRGDPSMLFLFKSGS